MNINPLKPQTVKDFFHPSCYPVGVASNMLLTFHIRSVWPVEDEDGKRGQLQQVAAACEQRCKLRAFCIAVSIAQGINPSATHCVSMPFAAKGGGGGYLALIPTR